MDFKNLCQNIDVSSLRARIPSLPAMPAMPQIKLPKSLPKLRPRRIFSRSREDLNRSKGSTKDQQMQQQQQSPSQQRSTRPSIPPADFINHSPRRISTISSLMHQQQRGDSQRGTYRSAGSVDDDYPTPRQFQAPGRLSRPISPIHTPINGATNEREVEGAVAKMSLGEKLQKGYKDITEFRLSHIFAKKTVVRKDIIQVDHYVECFNEDRVREQAEQERRDRKIADNYRFNFKLSRQDTDNSKRSMSSDESPKQEATNRGKGVQDQSEDESGMEATPPPRKPGIASTRFARMRNPPLEQHISDDSNIELDEDEEVPVRRGVQQQQKIVQSSPESAPKAAAESRGAKALHKLRSLGKRSEETPEKIGEKKRRAPLSPQQSEEKQEPPVATENDNPLNVLKQNIKRFSKSIRRTRESDSNAATNAAEDTECEGTPKKETKQISRTEKFAARLRKFASHEASTENLDESSPKKTEEQRSPKRTAISNKLQTWKMSFKRKPSEADEQTGEETSPERDAEKEKRTDNLMKKLRNLRQRKRASSTDDLDATEDEANPTSTDRPKDGSRRAVNFEERFEQARQRTFKKVNEKMQQIKFFHKSQENIEKESGTTKKDVGKPSEEEVEEEQSDEEHTVYIRRSTAARRAAAYNTPTDSEEEQQTQPGRGECFKETKNAELEFDGTHIQHTRALWTTKNLLTDSFDSETDTEFPRVLIHQDHSDQFESTLIIAVTRPAPPVTPTTPIIEEIHEATPLKKPKRPSGTPSPVSSRAEWIPNNQIISGFLEITPPSQRRLSAEAILPAPRGHTRKMSMDSSSDSDSWIPEAARNTKLGQQSKEGSVEGASAVTLNSIDEHEEPWKVHQTYCDEKLYKAKSIDIFEASVRTGGATAAFDDFEEELRDEPILKVPQRYIDSSFEKDSSEEPFAADDDNSSRVTKILVSIIREECEEVPENEIDERSDTKVPQLSERQLCNSNESFIANLDESERSMANEYANDESKEYEDDDGGDGDRPPSAAPSPPPPMSPPPPPLPLRKPALVTTKSIEERSTPPTTNPPMPPAKPSQPPRVPDRTPSMTRIAKPLVKTSSLRLAYNEQVNPSDIGKVNKLISRFETPQSHVAQRPRIIRRRLTRDESEEYSDDEDDLEEDEDEELDSDAINANAERDATPTPTNTPRTYSLESNTESLRTTSAHVATRQKSVSLEETTIITNRSNLENGNQTKICSEVPRITLTFDNNSNWSLSRASSEYGSPLEYPSSLIGSTETTPIPERRPQDLDSARNTERNRRSMTRDDDKFLSFDSDDENSYYSISSTGSSRYVVEI